MNLEERILIYIFMIEMISFANRGKKFSCDVFSPILSPSIQMSMWNVARWMFIITLISLAQKSELGGKN